MDVPKPPSKNGYYYRKAALFVVGAMLLVGTFAGGNYKSLANWGTAELVGANLWNIFAIVGGAYLVYRGVKTSR